MQDAHESTLGILLILVTIKGVPSTDFQELASLTYPA